MPPRTLLEVKTYIDQVILDVKAEVALSVPVAVDQSFPDESKSKTLRDRLEEELAVIEVEDYVHDWRVSRTHDLCTASGFIVIEFRYDADTQDPSVASHEVRYEVYDQFYVEER